MVIEEGVAVLRQQAFGIGYRMLGDVAEAEDVAQEVALRLVRLEQAPREPVAWVRTVATRLSIDALRRAKVRRATYVGPWLPDPLPELLDPSPGPQARAELKDSLSQAFLVLLERLTPLQRTAFLLHDVFGEDYPTVAGVLDRSQASCRQLVSRARGHLRAE